MLRGRRSAFALALLLAITGAAAQDPTTSPTPTTSTPTPSTTTSTPSPATTTPAPAPTTATPTSTPTSASTPSTSTKLPAAAAGVPVNNSVLTVQFADACADSTLFLREDDLGVVCENCTDYTSSAKLPALQITTGLTTKRVQLSTLERSSLNSLVIQSTSGTVPQLGVTSRSFVNLAAMTALSFTRVDFTDTRASLTVPASLAYLKLSSTNAVDLSLTIKNNNPSELKQVDFVRNQFTSLPLIFYERKYTSALEINKDFSFTGETTELSAEEYANAKANVGSALSSLVAFQESCNGSAVAPTTAAHVVCLNSALSGIRSIKDSGAHSTGSSQGDAAGGATPTPSVTRAGSSTDTTLTIIVIVVAVIAAILAYFVARRYFCTASSSSASPSHNERAVGLISKEDTQTANGKLSFISGDDTLRQIRLEQQDVSLGKSLGTGFLWTGDFQGRKVVIKRVEAESNDSRVTKALINQARSLVPVAHPNIAKLVGVTWIQGTDFGIVAEFMEKGTLKSVLMDLDTELDLQSKLHMCLDIAQALVYLHNPERNMYMKSLSSRKVLVNGAIECKLNLFECHATTTKIEVPDVFGAGEMAWWAPELVLHKTALDPRKVNIFALGVLICEIITRATPYQSVVDDKGHTLADLELTQRIRRQERLQPHENRHEFTELPSALRDVVERCLSYQPHLRPTAEEVVQCLEAVKDYSERMGSTTSL